MELILKRFSMKADDNVLDKCQEQIYALITERREEIGRSTHRGEMDGSAVASTPPAGWDSAFCTVSKVGEALAVLRVKAHTTQIELARVLSAVLKKIAKDGVMIGGIMVKGTDGDQAVSQSYISKVEKGKTSVSLSRLALLCFLLGCSLSDVFKVAEMLVEHADKPENEVNDELKAWAQASIDEEVK